MLPKGGVENLKLNRVLYDEELITTKNREQRLQETGTYIRTLSTGDGEKKRSEGPSVMLARWA
ncbi:hypothetical protein [Desulfogranum marinum]|uniref:hypothetical protein n=1 Tax=Desulfogranum marinum TaxID=453220 RepID=UPI00196464F5|nr:hypothetical protein [Desulfogranum marinum]MBM9512933.1 hypothetical protein [Desulfogranum marinum]